MTYTNSAQNQSIPWRDVLSVHPAAELLPRMKTEAMQALGEDINANGQQTPIVIFADAQGKQSLLDGISRLDAMVRVNLEVIKDGALNPEVVHFQVITGVDPVAYVFSANVYRRHFTTKDKRILAGNTLRMFSNKSDRQIAEWIGISHHTVKAVREELIISGQIAQISRRLDKKGHTRPATKPTVTKGEDVVSVVESAEQRKALYAADVEAPKPDTTPTAPDQHDGVDQHADHAGEHGGDDHHAGRHQGADQHHGENGASNVSAARAPETQILPDGKATSSVPEVVRKLTGTEVAAAFNELSRKECAEFFAAVSPAKNCVLRQHFENTDAEIAKLMRESLALLTHAEHNKNDIYKRIARVVTLTDADKTTAGKSNAKLDPALFRTAVGLAAGTKH